MAFWRHFVEKVTCLARDAISTQSRAWMVRDATSFASIIARGYTIMRTCMSSGSVASHAASRVLQRGNGGRMLASLKTTNTKPMVPTIRGEGRRSFAAQAQMSYGRNSYTPAGPRATRVRAYAGDQHEQTAPPSTVTWTPELANSVTIIGNVGADPEIRHFQSGTCVANVRIAVNGGRKSEMQDGVVEEDKTNWFAVDVWGEEGLRMAEHVRKGRTICVQGLLKTDTWTDKDTGAPRSRVKIVAKNFSFVQSSKSDEQRDGGAGGGGYESSYTPAAQAAPRQQQARQPQASQQMGMPAGTSPKEALWRSLAEEPDTWWDNRDRKAQPGANPRSPDFKHKESGEALWIESRDTPAWVLETLSEGGGQQAQQQRQQPANDGYYGASNPGAYEPDYNQPYGQQAQYAGYQPLQEGGYTPAQEFNPDDPPF